MLERQRDYAAKRRFRDHVIFQLPYYTFHLSLREVAHPTMTNEKYNMANGKLKTITPRYFSAIASETAEMERVGRTFCLPPALAPCCFRII
jgi:hypothetical protein